MEPLEIKVFLSSTFHSSMISARDAFRNEMLAKLNAIAGQIQGNVFLNDFELGIPEGVEALTVINTCLDAITTSDYFVGILGEERGTLLSDYLVNSNWKESPYKLLIQEAIGNKYTVLELEFLCAVKRDIKSYFYFDTKRKIYDYDKSVERMLFMNSKSITGFSSLEELKKSVIERLEETWNLRYGLFAEVPQKEKDNNIILANKIRYYVPNGKCIQAIDAYVASDSTQIFEVIGKSGSGKTTILFDWFNQHLYSEKINILFFASEYIASSLDELLEQILYEIQCIECEDYISEYENQISDLKRVEYFKNVLGRLRESYVILIDGLEHIFSHAGIKSTFILPQQLQRNIKIVVTGKEKDIDERNRIVYSLDKFDAENFAKIFFEKEGKLLIYNMYKDQIAGLLRPDWTPDAIRLMLSSIIITAKYNNIESIILKFAEECERYDNPYCSYVVLLNRYFTVNQDEPLKEALLFLYHSQNGIRFSALQSVIPSGERLGEIFNVIYFLLQKNTYNRYLLSNSSVRAALEILYKNEIQEYEVRYAELNYSELVSKAGKMEEAYDLWEEHIGYLLKERKIKDLKQLFIECLGQIANLWYYNRNLLLQAFDLVNTPAFITQIKEKAIIDEESNAPFYVSHLLYEYGYFKDAAEIYKRVIAQREKFNLSEKDLAALYNNLGMCIWETREGEQYLIQGYQIRRQYFYKDKISFFESCDNLFEFYWRNNDREKAIKYLNEAVEICETYFRKDSLECMKCNIHKACVEEDSDPAMALRYYNQALIICESIYGEENIQNAKIYQHQGVLYLKMQNFDLALECGIEANRIYEKEGIYNIDCLYIYNLIGSASLALEEQGSVLMNTTGDSKSWFRKALHLCKEVTPTLYHEILQQLIEDFPDISQEYWTSNDEL